MRREMKIAIMSDVHANPRALETALEDAAKRGCTRFVLLGDMTGYGYDAKKVIEIVRKRFDVILMGNHDSACSGLEPAWEVMAISNYDVDRQQREQLSPEDIDWLRGLDYHKVEKELAFTHGDFTNPKSWNYIISTQEAVQNFFSREERLMFCGHTHHAAIWEATAKGKFAPKLEKRFLKPALKAESVTFKLKEGSRYIVNVGSVGYPRNDLCSTYGIYDEAKGRVTIRRLPFDFKSYIADMLANNVNFPLWLCELLLKAKGK